MPPEEGGWKVNTKLRTKRTGDPGLANVFYTVYLQIKVGLVGIILVANRERSML